MFRCITELKGLVIDIDSFKDDVLNDWGDVLAKYKCIFLVSNEENMERLQRKYGEKRVYRIESYMKFFAPNPTIHKKMLSELEINATEIAYVSRDRSFLDNAMSFLGATIWVTERITYDDAGKAPDLICRDFDTFKHLIKKEVQGFLGEVATYPNDDLTGMIIPILFDVDGDKYPMYMLGRYFCYSHYMSQLHPYSTAIYLNKHEAGKAFGKYNDKFSSLYVSAIRRLQSTEKIDGIVSVPTRPDKSERFEPILNNISEVCNINNLNKKFKCVQNYPSQKNLSLIERQENICGVFRYDGNLDGKNIVLIDDIVTTGSTIRECISVLKRSGANQIFVIILAINQIQGYYWSSDVAQVCCSRCEVQMRLFINSRNNSFFYSCSKCGSTKGFDIGRAELCKYVNEEMQLRKRD